MIRQETIVPRNKYREITSRPENYVKFGQKEIQHLVISQALTSKTNVLKLFVTFIFLETLLNNQRNFTSGFKEKRYIETKKKLFLDWEKLQQTVIIGRFCELACCCFVKTLLVVLTCGGEKFNLRTFLSGLCLKIFLSGREGICIQTFLELNFFWNSPLELRTGLRVFCSMEKREN